MIKIVAGLKGSGKTKKIISDANNTVKTAKGNVVFIEKSNQLMYDLDRDIRLWTHLSTTYRITTDSQVL